MIEYKKGSLFDAPEGSYLLHACNAQGVWGAGIAKQFYNRFPEEYGRYLLYCQNIRRTGEALILNQVICLIVSEYYGSMKDSPTTILNNTKLALLRMLDTIRHENLDVKEIHMPKINSGLFNVPWYQTEAVINDIFSGSDIKIVVWEL